MLRPLADDTSPEAEALLFEHYRGLEVHEKLHIVFELGRFTDELALEGLRERYPAADENELRLRLAALKYGRETVLAAFGWDPELQGW